MATVKDGAKFVESWRWIEVVPESWCKPTLWRDRNHKEAEPGLLPFREKQMSGGTTKGEGKRSRQDHFPVPKGWAALRLSFHERIPINHLFHLSYLKWISLPYSQPFPLQSR